MHITSSENINHSTRSVSVILLLTGISLFIRLPYFFPAVINWDESTFILMGQSIIDGNLPYTTLWDLKPPLSFFTFAFFISVFGKSIFAIRLCGLLFVVATAYWTYFIGNSLYGKRAGLIAATLTVIFISTAEAGQATMTEILAVLPLMGALALFIRGKYSPGILFTLGMLISTASLIRLNLAYVAVAVFIFILIEMRRLKVTVLGLNLFAFVAGGVFVIILLAVPYLATSQATLFVNSAFIAPLKYSSSRLSAFKALASLLINGFGLQNALLWVPFLIGATVLTLKNLRGQTTREREEFKRVGVFLIAVAWSIVASGAGFAHYLIQIVPIMSLFAGVMIDRAIASRTRIMVSAMILIGLAMPLKPVFDQYKTMAHQVISDQPLSNGPQYEIAEWLNKNNPHAEPVYLMTDHIVYWFTSGRPLTKATTHPSNIAKEYILDAISGEESSTTKELLRVLSLTPLFIVKNEETWYLRDKPEAKHILDQTLSEQYARVAVVGGRHIYKLRSRF